MLSRIGDTLPRLRVFEKLFSNHPPLRHALSEVYLDIITFCTKATLVFKKLEKAGTRE
jgi:hypothetical protein